MSSPGPQFPGFTFLRPPPEPRLTPDPIPVVPPELQSAPPPPPSASVPPPAPEPEPEPAAPIDDTPASPAPEPVLAPLAETPTPEPAPEPPPAPQPEPVAPPAPLDESPYRITLAARDPWCFHVWWDVNTVLHREAATQSADGKLHLRLCRANGTPQQSFPVNEDEYSRFLPVGEPGATLHAELGIFSSAGDFTALGRSHPVTAPRDRATDDTSASYVTVPPDAPLSATVTPLGAAGLAAIATPLETPAADPTAGETVVETTDEGVEEIILTETEAVLDTLLDFPDAPEALNGSSERYASSLDAVPAPPEPARLVRRIPSLATRVFQLPASPLLPDVAVVWQPESSPDQWLGGASEQLAERDFFLHVNAEVILYGGTKPGSKLHIAGQEVPLGPDGSFRLHFVLPDGSFHLPVSATSPDGVETRGALVSFLRLTERQGEVGHSPQPIHLSPPGE